MNKSVLVLLAVLAAAGAVFAADDAKRRRPLPHNYGKVIINNFSEKAGLAPVEFDHWLHRAKFTCRLCHVDVGFAMQANGTEIKAADIMRGYYCGACHNGKLQHGDRKVFEACSKDRTDMKRCERCHSGGKDVKREYDFKSFTAKMPKERFGNGINWEQAEEEGLIKPIDFLEGVSIKKKNLANQKDFSLEPKSATMSKIIFSHKKHTIWNGCEVCHPDIFVGVKKGSTKYSMKEIAQGKFCGACHTKVAFPIADCKRCHSEPARRADSES
ncbi:MAG: hypothetical protein HZA17_03045 [Nitrospirae bacterium]|nr:hypothetical protein [Nitrospirota bacterium]